MSQNNQTNLVQAFRLRAAVYKVCSSLFTWRLHFLYYKYFKYSESPWEEHVWFPKIRLLTASKYTLGISEERQSSSSLSQINTPYPLPQWLCDCPVTPQPAEGKPPSCLWPVYQSAFSSSSAYWHNNKIKSIIMYHTWLQSQHQTNHTIEEGMTWYQNTQWERFSHKWHVTCAIKFTETWSDNVCLGVIKCCFKMMVVVSFHKPDEE